jgi:hypothetical protein
VWLVHAFYLIFKFTASLRQFLNNFVRAAGDIAAPVGLELYELADVKFVGRHSGSVLGYKLSWNVARKMDGEATNLDAEQVTNFGRVVGWWDFIERLWWSLLLRRLNYWNWTRSFVASSHITLQVLCSWSDITNSNVEGIP